jgi:hypothetical protein
MFTTSSIASYIESPDACTIELTEAIWTELGWTTKGDVVRKIESELIEGTDYITEVFSKVANNSGGRPTKVYSLSADKPGLRNIVEFISQPNALNAAKASVQEIASNIFGVDLETGEIMSLGRTCATTYRTWHNAEPEKELQEINGVKRAVAVYGTEMYSTIDNWLVNKGYEI